MGLIISSSISAYFSIPVVAYGTAFATTTRKGERDVERKEYFNNNSQGKRMTFDKSSIHLKIQKIKIKIKFNKCGLIFDVKGLIKLRKMPRNFCNWKKKELGTFLIFSLFPITKCNY